MATNDQAQHSADAIDLEELLKDLDVILDAWFMGLVTPALDEARQARGAPRSEAA